MKDYRKLQYLIALILLAALGIIIVHFFVPSIVIVPWLFYLALAIAGFMLSLTLSIIFTHRDKNRLILLENYLKQWNNISYRVKEAGEKTFNEMPIGIILYNEKLDVEWANNHAKTIFINILLERNLKSIDKNLAALVLAQTPIFNVTIYKSIYRCELNVKSRILYLLDITEQEKIISKYEKRRLTLGLINLDNFESAVGSLEAQERSQQISNLIGILATWSEKYNIALKSFTNDRFLIIMDNDTLERLTHDGFLILDEIKDYCTKQSLRLSLSIGIATKDIPSPNLMKLAEVQLETALNRGGNQVVINKNDAMYYYGAKSEAYDGRTAIAVRLKAEELRDTILAFDQVFIMAHKETDADAYGACIALRAIALALNKEAYIVFSEKNIDVSIVNVYESIKKEHQNYLSAFYTPVQALEKINDQTLLVIVDCHTQNLLLDERLEKVAKHIAILDHHRRTAQALKRHDYIYVQASASSSVELIVEMFDYFTPYEIAISEIEATWMLMGVMIDTNSFLYRTTSRTYQVLAKLQTYGASMLKVQNYLRENYHDYIKKNAILNNLEIVNGMYAIATCDDDIYLRSFIAKVAEDALKIDKIKMAFCIGRISEDSVGISARSFDKANAQMIMERLGGGGHFNNAATQLKNIDKETAKSLLKQAIKDSFAEGDQAMKIILTQTVKGKGKINDIIEVPMGHANFLIRTNQAIEATSDNIQNLERSKLEEKRKQEALLQAMQDFKKKIDSLSITISVRVGRNGKLFGTVSPKQIVEEYRKQHKIELDKRKIILDKDIDALGTYKIPIQIHKEVTAIIVLYIVEMV